MVGGNTVSSSSGGGMKEESGSIRRKCWQLMSSCEHATRLASNLLQETDVCSVCVCVLCALFCLLQPPT